MIFVMKLKVEGCEHEVCYSPASEGSEVACKCLVTHTGLIDICGSTYRTRETTDNVADEVSLGYGSYTAAASYVDGLA